MFGKIFTFCLVGLMGVILMAAPARSQMPETEFTLRAAAQGAGIVNLSWQPPSDFTVSYYRVYRALIRRAIPQVSGYVMIDSTIGTEYEDRVPPISTPDFYQGFRYLVSAFDISGDSISSNPADIYMGQLYSPKTDKVTITSTPSLDATVDSLYTYQVTAVSDSASALLRYSLGEHPPLMAMDSSGLISWIPQSTGWKEVEIVVTSSEGGEARQDYAVKVAVIDGKVAGIVTDTVGNPLKQVVIDIYQAGGGLPVHHSIPAHLIEFFNYQTETDSTGHYMINNIDLGNYRIRATPLNQNYLPAWYDSLITVLDTSTHIVNFALENRFHLLPKFTVSGTVADSTGAAIKGAWVVFARSGFVFNEAREDQEEWSTDENYRDFFEDAIHDKDINHNFVLDDIHSPYVFRTYVDSNGAYLDTLPEGRYVVFAKAKGYHRTFLNNEFNLLSADILGLTSDTTNINFTLYPIPQVALGWISGSVLDSTSGAGIGARVIAFRDVWDYPDTLNMHVIGTYFGDADSTGAYTFSNLPPGYYKILALPLGGYAPSFYSLTGPTTKWKEATAVQVNGSAISGVNIYVMPLPDSISGYVSINGTVRNSSSRMGVNGAVVYAADVNGNILGYGVTDGTGSYTISGLAPGSYSLSADVMGYGSSSSNSSSPSYDGNGNPVPSSSDLTVSPEMPAGVHTNPIKPTSYSLEQNYPNPFNPTTQIAFNIAQPEHVNVTIFNILGQRIATIVDGQMGPGAHIVMWDGRNQHGELLPSGVYFYRLSTPSFTAVKKMLLLK